MKEAVLLLAKERVRRIKKLFPGSKRPNMKQLPRWSQIFDKSKPLPGPGRAKRIIRHPHLQEIEFFLAFQSVTTAVFMLVDITKTMSVSAGILLCMQLSRQRRPITL